MVRDRASAYPAYLTPSILNMHGPSSVSYSHGVNIKIKIVARERDRVIQRNVNGHSTQM